MTDDDSQTTRQRPTRRDRRDAGKRSTRLARALMELSSTAVAELELDDDLREAVDSARAVTSPIARRRAERTLAGELRHHELDDVEAGLASARASSSAGTRLFQLAERWRVRLIEEGIDAAAELPGGPGDELRTLIENARRERATGKPRGAARALFRHVFAVLESGSR